MDWLGLAEVIGGGVGAFFTGWTTSVSAGDTLRFNIDSATTITRLHLALTVTVP